MKTTLISYFLAFTANAVGSYVKTSTGVQRINGHDFSIQSTHNGDEFKESSRNVMVKGNREHPYASWILQTSFPHDFEYTISYDNDFGEDEEDEEEEEEEEDKFFGQPWKTLRTRGGKQWAPGPPKKEPDAPYDPNWKPPKMNINPDQKIVKNTLRCSQRTHKCKGMVLYENGS